MSRSFESERGVNSVVIAWDALVAVTHPSCPVDGLTRDQLVDIVSGRTRNWKDIGGADQRIIVVGRKGNESGVGVMARWLILNDPNFSYPADTVLLRSTRPLELLVEKTPGAIAITGVSSAKKRNLKILEINGVAPTRERIAAGTYPYYRPLYLAYSPRAAARTLDFIDWIQGEKAQAVITAQGTVNLAMGLPLVSKYRYWNAEEPPVNLNSLRARAARIPTAVLTHDAP